MTVTYYELLEDGTIGRSTPFADVAADNGLTLTTEKEIVYAWDNKRYFKGEEPEKPTSKINEEQRAKRQTAFTEEADPLKYDYEEACARYGDDSEEAQDAKVVWLQKKDEIRERFPYAENEES